MRPDYKRGPNRFHLIHHVLARLRGCSWFSAHQVAGATFYGVGRVHQQQLKRVRLMLDRYVLAGILEREDAIAACTLYRHRNVTLEQVDREMVQVFEVHAHQRRMTPSYQMGLKLLDHYLDQVVPRDADPGLFDRHGHLMNPELRAHLDRMRQRPAGPRVLAYLSTISNPT